MLTGILLVACRSKPKQPDDASGFFPVLSYLQSQVRHIDTSLYTIVKMKKTQQTSDTSYLRREEFKAAAQDFLSLPDIASGKLKDDYTETKLYDEDLKKVVITYAPKNKGASSEVTREDVLIEPDAGSGDQVQTIYIETALNKGDSTVQKKMTWNVAGSFQVIRIATAPAGAEAVETMDVSWSGTP